jgi:hypothetical protein
MSLHNQSLRLADLGRRENALAAIEEAVTLILPYLERAPYWLPDSGMMMCRRYLDCCGASEQEPSSQIVERFASVFRAAGMLDDFQ